MGEGGEAELGARLVVALAVRCRAQAGRAEEVAAHGEPRRARRGGLPAARRVAGAGGAGGGAAGARGAAKLGLAQAAAVRVGARQQRMQPRSGVAGGGGRRIAQQRWPERRRSRRCWLGGGDLRPRDASTPRGELALDVGLVGEQQGRDVRGDVLQLARGEHVLAPELPGVPLQPLEQAAPRASAGIQGAARTCPRAVGHRLGHRGLGRLGAEQLLAAVPLELAVDVALGGVGKRQQHDLLGQIMMRHSKEQTIGAS